MINLLQYSYIMQTIDGQEFVCSLWPSVLLRDEDLQFYIWYTSVYCDVQSCI